MRLQLYLGSQRHWGNILTGLSLEMLGHSSDSSARLPLAHPIPRKGGNQHQAGDFPGGPVVKNLPSNAGDMSSIPGQGTKISCAVWQLSLSVTTREKLASCNQRSLHATTKTQ